MRTDEIADKAKEFNERAQSWQEQACSRARQVGEAADVYVRENTWASVAIALGVGCLVGLLLAQLSD